MEMYSLRIDEANVRNADSCHKANVPLPKIGKNQRRVRKNIYDLYCHCGQVAVIERTKKEKETNK